MPKQFVKKSEQIAMKLKPETLAAIEEVSLNEDRPLGYVARELMIRGLVQYRSDGKLRDPSSPYGAEEAMHRGLRAAIPLIDSDSIGVTREPSESVVVRSRTVNVDESSKRNNGEVRKPRKRASR